MKITRGSNPAFGAFVLLPLIGVTLVLGCEPEVPQRDDTGERIEAIFDPETETIPTPNDAAMDEDGTLPGLSDAQGGTAQGHLSDYMDELTGWPRSTPIEIPFSGALDEESIDDDTVRLYRVDSDENIERAAVDEHLYRETDEGLSYIEMMPAQPAGPGDQFAAVATNDLVGAEGESVGAPLPIFLAASKSPLVDDDGNPQLEILDDDRQTAQTLERMRQMLASVFEGIEDGVGEDDPVDRDDLVAAFRWTTMPEPALSFYPDFAEVPLPNTAALDEDGTFPESGTCYAGEESAAGTLDDYLTGLSGWPAETPITIEFTVAIEPESIGDDDVQLWRKSGDDWLRDDFAEVEYRDFSVDPCGEEHPGSVIEIEPGVPMEPDEEYFAVATRDIEPVDIDGESDEESDNEETPSLIPELPMFLALQPEPLIDDDGNSLVSTLSDDDAAQIAGIQASIDPALERMEEEFGLAYDDLAGVSSWYTWDDTFLTFDPETGTVPFPNSAVTEDGTVNLPIPDGAGDSQQALFEHLNEREGFSTTAPISIPLQGEIDEESMDFEGVRLFNQDSPADAFGAEELELRVDDDIGRLILEPKTTLPPGVELVVALRDDMEGTNGRPIQASPFVTLLTGEYPVAEDGESLVDLLDDEAAVELEENRQEFNSQLPLLGPVLFDDWGDDDGTNRENIAAVWTFTTEEPVEPMRERRATVRHSHQERDELEARRHCEVDGTCGPIETDEHYVEFGDSFDDPNDPSVSIDTSHLRALYSGAEFETVDADGELERVGISVYIPDTDEDNTECDGDFDVVIAGHGLGADRWSSGLTTANEMAAQACLATVALDLPAHGGRTTGVDDVHPETTPSTSGDDFLDADLIASKQNLAQSVGDLFGLVRVIEGDGESSGLDELFDGLDAAPVFDAAPTFGDPVAYLGISLGGMMGVVFSALEPSVQTAALHGAGGRLSWLIEGDDDGPSAIGAPLIEMLEEEFKLTPGDEDFFDTMVFVQWLVDRVDPFVYGQPAVSSGDQPLVYDADDDGFDVVTGDSCEEDSDCPEHWECRSAGDDDVCVQTIPPVEPMLQKAEGDRVVVNRGTEALASELGIDLQETTFDGVDHAFITIFDDTDDQYDAAVCARLQAGAWIESGLFADAVLPSELSADECL